MTQQKKQKTKLFIILMVVVFAVAIALSAYLLWRGTGFYVIPSKQSGETLERFQFADGQNWHIIDNDRFGIDNTGNDARKTTDGINDALKWAKEQGHENLRFAPGTYLIQCSWNNRYIAPNDGILVPSGLTLDLGSSTFQLEANDFPAYCIFGVIGQSDVTILGGTLIGDLDDHVFSPDAHSPSHEWGFGICVSASSNVLIQDVTIKNMTGDGIILEGSYRAVADGGKVSSGVRIYGCNISSCRRQGISVIGASDSEIAENTIYNIAGTDPQYGIDVEPEFDHPVNQLKIHHNLIYGCGKGAIICRKGSDYSVYSNICRGNNIIAVECSDVNIFENIIESSSLIVYKEAEDVMVYNNQFDLFSRLVIEK